MDSEDPGWLLPPRANRPRLISVNYRMSFDRIFRSSLLMGGASVITMFTALLRGKVVALLLGPAGVGMMGVLNQLTTVLTQICGFGLGSSAVKFVSAADASERDTRVNIVHNLGYKLSVFGGGITLIIALPVCFVTFGSLESLPLVMIAGLSVPLGIISMALGSLLQTQGDMKAVARTQIMSAVAAFLIGVPLIWLGGVWGLALSVVISSACPLWIMGRQLKFRSFTWRGIMAPQDSHGPLIKMGLSLIGTTIIAQLAAYASRIIVVHQLGIDSGGYYQAAFSIAGTIPGFIFSAMSTDFYPRVSGAKTENEALDITDRQIKAGIIMAAPFFIGLVLFGKQLLGLFYTSQFWGAQDILLWMIWGVACRLVSWPLGYWLLARSSPRQLFWLESIGALTVTALTLILVPFFGLAGAGIAFGAGALIYGLIMIIYIHRKHGRGISAQSYCYAGLAISAMGVAQYGVMRQCEKSTAVLILLASSILFGLLYLKTSRDERHA